MSASMIGLGGAFARPETMEAHCTDEPLVSSAKLDRIELSDRLHLGTRRQVGSETGTSCPFESSGNAASWRCVRLSETTAVSEIRDQLIAINARFDCGFRFLSIIEPEKTNAPLVIGPANLTVYILGW